MQKPSINRLSLFSGAMAVLLSAMPNMATMPDDRMVPKGKRRAQGRVVRPWRKTSKYVPIATPVRNPLVAAQVNRMHEKWQAEQFPSRVTKTEPDPGSLSSIKLVRRCSRPVARMLKAHTDAKQKA